MSDVVEQRLVYIAITWLRRHTTERSEWMPSIALSLTISYVMSSDRFTWHHFDDDGDTTCSHPEHSETSRMWCSSLSPRIGIVVRFLPSLWQLHKTNEWLRSLRHDSLLRSAISNVMCSSWALRSIQNVMQLVVELLLPLLLQHFGEMKRMNVIDRYVIDDQQCDCVGRVRLT